MHSVLPNWAGETVLVAATGPSLEWKDLQYARGKVKTIVVNDAYSIAPWADILYASDAQWWDAHGYVREFRGRRWSHDRNGSTWPHRAASAKIDLIQGANGIGISTDPHIIYFGGNSGFQAMHLAVNMGAKTILLTGFDCGTWGGKSHFFGEHPQRIRKISPYPMFRQAFNVASEHLVKMGVNVINCSRMTTINCFPKARLVDVI